jgi:hypothetical protein
MPRSAYCRIEELGPLRLRGARAGSDLRGLAGRHEYQALAERTVGRSLKITPPVKFHGRIISRRILRWERRCKGGLFALCGFTGGVLRKAIRSSDNPARQMEAYSRNTSREQHRKDKEIKFCP